MKGVFFRPCPKCGRICNSELDMCEICSGKIAKPEPPKPIAPAVTPIVEPIVEEVAPIVEEQVATEEVIEEVATEENIVEETINEEKQEEVVVPAMETKAPKGKGIKGLYALVAVLMLVIVALVVVIMQDRQPDIAVNNTTLQSNTTTSTTLKQETETTTEITEGTTVDNAGETLAPVTTTKKAQNTNKETTTKKNTSSSTKETTTKKITTTTTTEANKVEFNPEIVYSKDTIHRASCSRDEDVGDTGGYIYYVDYIIENVYIDSRYDYPVMTVEYKVVAMYEWIKGEGIVEVSSFNKALPRDYMDIGFSADFYTSNGELYGCGGRTGGTKTRDYSVGLILKGGWDFTDDEIENVARIVF